MSLGTSVRIDILYLEGCPHLEATLDRTLDVAASISLDAEVRQIEVRDDAEAERLRFPGSPTVRVDGVDIESPAPSAVPHALSCRLYGSSGVPPHDMLLRAFFAAQRKTKGGPRREGVTSRLPHLAGLAAFLIGALSFPLASDLLAKVGTATLAGSGLGTLLGTGSWRTRHRAIPRR